MCDYVGRGGCLCCGGDCEAGDAKRMANAVLPLGKGVRAAVTRMGEKGAADAFAIQGTATALSQFLLLSSPTTN